MRCQNRINVINHSESNSQIHAQIVNDLKEMLDQHNVLTKSFRMVRDRFQIDQSADVKLRLIGKRGSYGRRYNLPTVSEVAALVVGDFEPTSSDRDIIIESHYGQLKRISELNAAYLDGYTMIESSRLLFYRLHQTHLRADFYKGLQEAVLQGDTQPSSKGQRVILSSSFTGGTRYMLQNYQDAMSICKWAGYPDLFITFTYNPKWPEITRFVNSRGLAPEDRPDIITRVFKVKLDHLIKDLRDNKVFGQIKADDDPIDVVINKPTIKEFKFLSWFEANKEFPEAIDLTYAEFSLKFVWKQQSKRWDKRKTSAFSIGRIFFVPPGFGEQYYLRLLLNIVRGPISYEDIRRINDIDHETFRDACYALGLLDDDKEYVDAIVEASHWGMPSYLRQLFAMLLISNSMSHSEVVWQSTWHLLYEDILHEQRRVLDNPGKTYIWKTLSAAIRSKGDVVLTVASSGIASLLLPGGRTAHSRFVIPLNITEDSTCNLKQGTPLAHLLIKTKLIIWDEAPMMHKHCFEALDKTLRDIIGYKDATKSELPFGGKTIVLGGDFRQILLVIPKGS
ncbi:hypothetical protein KY290_021244 [Solanum tuberosum]|uniref:ATP-dependent DNA helicase n=1 Tax=Solanum tuberosum TaxID=4113 RepID=A0ABQ7V0Y0_SOLTU|nr:hypothetical protein KY289_020407 [Solanum tuberosum]KAH0693067.1 hypothetical protein KY285_020164 [Solanum tuberosum]KAH0757751.1 hypothetical protein KY290_021244 [Solanum tuberosum]